MDWPNPVTRIVTLVLLVVAALLPWSGLAHAQEAAVQLRELHGASQGQSSQGQNPSQVRKTAHLQQNPTQATACDGTARSGSVKGQMRSTSNCERKAAAARNAARRAAVHATGAPGKGGTP